MVRCIKDEEGKVLTENDEIRERWQRFFAKLLNGEGVRDDYSRAKSVAISTRETI